MNQRLTAPIVISAGDPAGIGPEIVWKACLRQPQWARRALLVGHWASLLRAQSIFPAAQDWRLEPVALQSDPMPDAPDRVIRVIPIAPEIAIDQVPLGQTSAAAGHIAAAAIQVAAHACLMGHAGALVTAPIHKQSLHQAGLKTPGHTELLQQICAQHLGLGVEQLPVRMMLATPSLRTVLVSVHISLKEAIAAVTIDAVLETLRLTHQAQLRHCTTPPRIAVAGLNPHAGEGGLMGREEQDIIGPAIALAQREGILASGPHSPDTVFMRARQTAPGRPAEFDLVVAMYHDQGLIPIKLLGINDGINITLGLPIVRTSPDHGTAFDLAGSGRAAPDSLLAAWQMAQTMVGVKDPA